MALSQDEPMLEFLLRFRLETADAIAIAELIDKALPAPERQAGVIVQLVLNHRPNIVEMQAMQIETMAGRSMRLRRSGPRQYTIDDGRLAAASVAKQTNTPDAATKPADAAAIGGLRRVHVPGANDITAGLIAAGAPDAIAAEALEIFRLHKAMPSDALKRAAIELVYAASAPEQLLAASAEVDGHIYRLWRFARSGQMAGYFDENGERIGVAELHPPIADGRITSPWGMRKHPVLRVMRFHMGVDYEAAAGTPVYAAADGVVEEARRMGNYGLYLKIAHGDRIATVYAHLLKLQPAVKPGAPVKRGDVVAYVGRSGLATGPHLYFEVMVDRQRVDPERWLGLGGGDRLSGADLAAFEQLKRRAAPAMRIGRHPF